MPYILSAHLLDRMIVDCCVLLFRIQLNATGCQLSRDLSVTWHQDLLLMTEYYKSHLGNGGQFRQKAWPAGCSMNPVWILMNWCFYPTCLVIDVKDTMKLKTDNLCCPRIGPGYIKDGKCVHKRSKLKFAIFNATETKRIGLKALF